MHDANALFKIEPDSLIAEDDHLLLGFSLNPEDELLAEHFSGFPVAPASLTLGFICKCVATHLAINDYRLEFRSARFSQPLVPGLIYTCNVDILRAPAGMHSAHFTICDPAGKVSVRGDLELHTRAQWSLA